MMQPGDAHAEYIDQDVYGEGEEDSGSNSDRSDESSGDEEDSSGLEEVSWKQWFLSLRGNEFFCEVDDEFIEDDFNLTGLNSMVPYYDYALDVMLDVDISMENLSEDQRDIIDTAAEVLYGLIHARFILTMRGMELMLEKFQQADFGRCPRVCCNGQPVLPVGQSDIPRNASVHVFCCKCHDVFYPRSTKHANVDGAFFGTTFCHLFLLTHTDHIPAMPEQSYLPRIYGFRIHGSSPYYQQRALRTEEAEENANATGGASGRTGNGSRRSGGNGGAGAGTNAGASSSAGAGGNPNGSGHGNQQSTEAPHAAQQQQQQQQQLQQQQLGSNVVGMEEDETALPDPASSSSRVEDRYAGFDLQGQQTQPPPQQPAVKTANRGGLSSFGGGGGGGNRGPPAGMPPPAVPNGGARANA